MEITVSKGPLDILDMMRSFTSDNQGRKATFKVVRRCKPFPVLMVRSDVCITIRWTAAVTNSLVLPR